MPCDDVTEIIEIALDGDDRLVDYGLCKRTCSAPVGDESLLLSELRGRSANELARLTDEAGNGRDWLARKHLAAIAGALRVYVGSERGAPADPCTLARISGSADGVEITATIAVDLPGRVPSCGAQRAAERE